MLNNVQTTFNIKNNRTASIKSMDTLKEMTTVTTVSVKKSSPTRTKPAEKLNDTTTTRSNNKKEMPKPSSATSKAVNKFINIMETTTSCNINNDNEKNNKPIDILKEISTVITNIDATKTLPTIINDEVKLINKTRSTLNNIKNTTTIHIKDDVNPNSSIFMKAAGASKRGGVGVQNLRNLWNQRIMANAIQTQQQQLKYQQQENPSSKRTQSINCLKTMSSCGSSYSSTYGDDNNIMQKSALSQSLIDCRSMPIEQIACVQRERDRIQREKDNFYKYKTAEQATIHRARASTLLRRVTVCGGSDDESFIEKIQPSTDQVPLRDTENIHSLVYYSTKITINDNKMAPLPNTLTPPPLPPPRVMRNSALSAKKAENLISTDNLNANDKKTKHEQSLKNNGNKNSGDSMNKESPLETSENKTLQCESTVRRISSSSNIINSSGSGNINLSGSNRRCSFKTHVRTYPIGGKMSKDNTLNNGSNIVARLTQQFNAIIQNDKKLLDEINRKNCILMARGGHIYKVVKNTELNNNNFRQNAIRRNGSRVKEIKRKFSRRSYSAVQNQINCFEHKDQQKPINMNNKNLTKNTETKIEMQSSKSTNVIDRTHMVESDKCQNLLTKNCYGNNRIDKESTTPSIPIVPKPTTTFVQVQQQLPVKFEQTKNVSSILECNYKDINHKNISYNSDKIMNITEADDKSENHSRSNDRKQKYAKIYEKIRLSKAFSSENKKYNVENIPKSYDKILDALEKVDQKLKGLSIKHEQADVKKNDFEKSFLSNSTCVHDANATNNSTALTQAVNVALVNSMNANQIFVTNNIIDNLQQDKVVKKSENKDNKNRNGVEDSIYEPIAEFKTFTNENKTDRMKTDNEPLCKNDNDMISDYESIADSIDQGSIACDGGYDSYEPLEFTNLFKSIDPPLPPALPHLSPICRNTNDKLPDLPKPKRRQPRSPVLEQRLSSLQKKKHLENNTRESHETLYDNDDRENIYSTIQNFAHCYESLHLEGMKYVAKCHKVNINKGVDSISLVSNPYESICSYRRAQISVSSPNGNKYGCSQSGSTLTLSSDHKTNSLYEDSLVNSLLHNSIDGNIIFGIGSNRNSRLSVCSNLSTSTVVCERNGHSSISGSTEDNSKLPNGSYTHLNIVASDNSDEWIDMTDTDEGTSYTKTSIPQFVVVRERFKVHRSPDWSKRVRDQRLHQNKTICYTEDDSDHYYETLSPPLALDNIKNESETLYNSEQSLPNESKEIKALAVVSDEYDSFDTDTDDVVGIDGFKKNSNDSGVEMCQMRLPDLPETSPTNQVYAIVRKFKNFISNKKVRQPQPQQQQNVGNKKIYENTSQFYVCNNSNIVNENTYENMSLNKSKNILKNNNNNNNSINKKNRKKLTQNIDKNEPYENTEFHTIRTKAKTSESFKSRFRKSLIIDNVGDSTASTQSDVASKTQANTPQLITMRSSTFYVDDITFDDATAGNGILDSGFSEKSTQGTTPTLKSATTAATSEITTTTSTAYNLATSKNCVTKLPNEAHKFNTVARKSNKLPKNMNAQRRRTTIGIRPHEPPPPPPSQNNDGRPASSTLWYAECGVFKINGNSDQPRNKVTSSYNGSHSSWYAEAGLYQTSGISVASSSGSSGVSTGNEAGLGEENTHSMFLNEPLYQIYNAAKLQSITRDIEDTEFRSSDCYEEISQLDNTTCTNGISTSVADVQGKEQKRPSALQLVEPKNGPSRTLWSEIPEVINSNILYSLSPRDRALQEAKFEIITSEASYLKSLNLLRSHYINHPLFRDTSAVSARDRKALFGFIVPVQECSECLLTELEQCWQDNVMLLGLSKRIFAAAEKHFHVYVDFCEHQGRMDRTLRRLKEAKTSLFAQNLELLEMSPNCCGLNLHSFLMLPMQRITRLPLLIDAVFSKMQTTDDEYDSWKMTLAIMNKLVTQCNEAANVCEQAYEIERISRQLEFPTNIRALAIAPMGVAKPGAKPRFLVKRGDMNLIWRGDDTKLTFGKKFSKTSIYVFLFSDLLVLTKRKSEAQFTVFDYCPRNMLTTAAGDDLPQLPTKDIGQSHCKNLIRMTLLENHERKTIEMLLSCPSVSEQERWLTAMRPPSASLPGEKLYEQWDCPQVIARHAFVSNEPDALNLEVGDVVNVTRKLADGWYQGERIRDGTVGWFPGTYTDEVNSAHVRARNLKQRYRLLTFTATYLESQKRK